MKNYLIKIIQCLVRNEKFWRFFNNTINKVSKRIEHERHKYINKNEKNNLIEQAISKNFPDLVVKNGVFRGLQYPKNESFGSVLFAKLLGSYEKELENILSEILTESYKIVVDIGCAEGYYAIGFALKMPSVQIYCFDTSEHARLLCNEMAQANNVEERVKVDSICTKKLLTKILSKGRSLIFSDCEGYEKEIFSKDMFEVFLDHDMLIETHDFKDIEISLNIRKFFEKSHNITVISSVDDIKKAQTYAYNEINGYSLGERYELLSEGRPAIMEWLFLEAKESKFR